MLAGTALRRVYCQAVRDEITALAVPPILRAFLKSKHCPARGTEKLGVVFKFRITHRFIIQQTW
ncbi:MAG TPA: hypothetical protein VEI46_05175 [Thermodesulfovibrionales bacterium]|nr:hypothetical protein [Thermodesulfovibrionales bacterium]